jgi:hypothetical protein
MSYADTGKYGLTMSKTGKYLTNTNYGNRIMGGQWRNTAAITTLTLTGDGPYASGTIFSLYGIAAA